MFFISSTLLMLNIIMYHVIYKVILGCMMIRINSTIGIVVILTIILSANLYISHTNAQPIRNIVFYCLDFSDIIETLKHLDNATDNYDSYNDGSAQEYVDTGNGYFVFEGNNTNTQGQYYDEPIAVVKFYNESNGYSSYAILPYNYTVTADFRVPSTPGYGNFYILPRYKDVDNKYEIAVNTQSNELVFNYVKGGSWNNLETIDFSGSLTISYDSWYRLEVVVSWEYNTDYSMYMNHFNVTIIDLSDTSSSFTTDFWDGNLTPTDYRGLGFLGFDDSHLFKVYMDNVVVSTGMEELGLEPSESTSPADLNFTAVYVWNDTDIIYIYMGVSQQISPDSSDTKYWVAQLDVDLDSRTSDSFNPDYNVQVSLDTSGNMKGNLFVASNGTWLGNLHLLGGGIDEDYIVVEVDKSSLTGLGNGLYLKAYSQLGSNEIDYYPGVPDLTGDYAIYYLSKPSPTSGWSSLSDTAGDASPEVYDILYLKSAYNSDLLFFNFTIAGLYPWSGGDTYIYQVFVDADNDASTGYQVGGLGADYLLEYEPGFMPRLWLYTGNGSTWSWSVIYKEDYMYNPGELDNVVLLVHKSDFNDPQLASTIKLYGQTVNVSELEDSTDTLVAPVPEYDIWVAVAILAASAILLARKLKWS